MQDSASCEVKKFACTQPPNDVDIAIQSLQAQHDWREESVAIRQQALLKLRSSAISSGAEALAVSQRRVDIFRATLDLLRCSDAVEIVLADSWELLLALSAPEANGDAEPVSPAAQELLGLGALETLGENFTGECSLEKTEVLCRLDPQLVPVRCTGAASLSLANPRPCAGPPRCCSTSRTRSSARALRLQEGSAASSRPHSATWTTTPWPFTRGRRCRRACT
jgi:hypothetical protein